MGEALFVYADRNELGILNTSQYRVLIPAKYLNKAGHKIVTETGGSITNVYGHKADTINYSHVPEVVLLERVVWPGRIEKLRLAGARRIIITFDDNYQLLPPGAASEYWKRNYGDFVKCLGLVDEVIVPSVALAADYSKLCKKISVVENYLDPDLWQAKTKYDNHPLTIGWGGSNQHVATWANKHFSSALREIQRLYGDKIRIVVYGDAAVSALSDGNVEFESRYLVPFDEWPKHCAQFDIGLAPLYGDRVLRCRSSVRCDRRNTLSGIVGRQPCRQDQRNSRVDCGTRQDYPELPIRSRDNANKRSGNRQRIHDEQRRSQIRGDTVQCLTFRGFPLSFQPTARLGLN